MPCIRCGNCSAGVPRDAAAATTALVRATPRDLDALETYGLMDCIECGCCDYVCPSQIPLVERFRDVKPALLERLDARSSADAARARFDARTARLERTKRAARALAKKRQELQRQHVSAPMPFATAPAPHVVAPNSVGRVMRQVLYALVPAVALHVMFFGPGLADADRARRRDGAALPRPRRCACAASRCRHSCSTAARSSRQCCSRFACRRLRRGGSSSAAWRSRSCSRSICTAASARIRSIPRWSVTPCCSFRFPRGCRNGCRRTSPASSPQPCRCVDTLTTILTGAPPARFDVGRHHVADTARRAAHRSRARHDHGRSARERACSARSAASGWEWINLATLAGGGMAARAADRFAGRSRSAMLSGVVRVRRGHVGRRPRRATPGRCFT